MVRARHRAPGADAGDGMPVAHRRGGAGSTLERRQVAVSRRRRGAEGAARGRASLSHLLAGAGARRDREPRVRTFERDIEDRAGTAGGLDRFRQPAHRRARAARAGNRRPSATARGAVDRRRRLSRSAPARRRRAEIAGTRADIAGRHDAARGAGAGALQAVADAGRQLRADARAARGHRRGRGATSRPQGAAGAPARLAAALAAGSRDRRRTTADGVGKATRGTQERPRRALASSCTLPKRSATWRWSNG